MRKERDSLGEREVPAAAYYGIQTQRAVENFPISGLRAHPQLIRAIGMIKQAAAEANQSLGLLTQEQGRHQQAAQEIITASTTTISSSTSSRPERASACT